MERPRINAELTIVSAIATFSQSDAFHQLKPYTRECYSTDIRQLDIFLRAKGITVLNNLSPDLLSEWLTQYRHPSTVDRKFAAAKKFFSCAGIDLPTITLPIKEKGLMLSFITNNEASRLLTGAANNPRNLALIRVALETGSNASEILDLNVGDIINRGNDRVDIRFTRKSETRTIPISIPTSQV